MLKAILLEAFLPVVASVLSIVVPGILVSAYSRFQAWTGIEIEARQREALQSALANAARLLHNRMLTRDHAIDYVLKSVPDALTGLKVEGRERVGQLLDPHILGQAAAQVARVNSNLPRDQPK